MEIKSLARNQGSKKAPAQDLLIVKSFIILAEIAIFTKKITKILICSDFWDTLENANFL